MPRLRFLVSVWLRLERPVETEAKRLDAVVFAFQVNPWEDASLWVGLPKNTLVWTGDFANPQP